MEPDPCELLGFSPFIHLGLEKVSHCLIGKRDAGRGRLLADGTEVLNIEKVFWGTDPKPTDLSRTGIPEE
jgi:hypothetical protein